MPMIDMPMEELRKYEGRSPCPADFDRYWEQALTEMRSVDPQAELVPAPYQAPGAACFDLYFTGVGEARIHGKYLRPARAAGPLPTLLIYHGYGCDAGDWFDKLAFVQAGFAVAALDCRGQGRGLSQDTLQVTGPTKNGHLTRGLGDSADKLYYRNVFLDTAQFASVVMGLSEVDETRIASFGGSQGGALAAVCAALEPRIRKAVIQFPFLCDFRHVWEIDLAHPELVDYFRRVDPAHAYEDEIFQRLGYIDVQNFSRRIQADVLWCCGLMDTVCPPSSQFAAYNKITGKKQMKIYPDFAHEVPPGFMDLVLDFLLDG